MKMTIVFLALMFTVPANATCWVSLKGIGIGEWAVEVDGSKVTAISERVNKTTEIHLQGTTLEVKEPVQVVIRKIKQCSGEVK